jgi:hypothetical protein
MKYRVFDDNSIGSWRELFVRINLAEGKAELQALVHSFHRVCTPWFNTKVKDESISEVLEKVEHEIFPTEGPEITSLEHSAVELHEIHDDNELLPTKPWKVPFGQELQNVALAFSWYFPLGQSAHAENPESEYWPTEQSKHTEDPRYENVPSGQRLQLVEAGCGENVPRAQALHLFRSLVLT